MKVVILGSNIKPKFEMPLPIKSNMVDDEFQEGIKMKLCHDLNNTNSKCY